MPSILHWLPALLSSVPPIVLRVGDVLDSSRQQLLYCAAVLPCCNSTPRTCHPTHPTCVWPCQCSAAAPKPALPLQTPLQCEPPAPVITCLTDTSKGCRTCQAEPDQLKCATCINAAHIINAAGVVSEHRSRGQFCSLCCVL